MRLYDCTLSTQVHTSTVVLSREHVYSYSRTSTLLELSRRVRVEYSSTSLDTLREYGPVLSTYVLKYSASLRLCIPCMIYLPRGAAAEEARRFAPRRPIGAQTSHHWARVAACCTSYRQRHDRTEATPPHACRRELKPLARPQHLCDRRAYPVRLPCHDAHDATMLPPGSDARNFSANCWSPANPGGV